MIHTHVEGGTGAGTKAAPKPPPEPWFCLCFDVVDQAHGMRKNPGYLVNCPDCGMRRP